MGEMNKLQMSIIYITKMLYAMQHTRFCDIVKVMVVQEVFAINFLAMSHTNQNEHILTFLMRFQSSNNLV